MFKTENKRMLCLLATSLSIGTLFSRAAFADEPTLPAGNGLAPITNPSAGGGNGALTPPNLSNDGTTLPANTGAGTALPPINMGGENIQTVPAPEPSTQTDANNNSNPPVSDPGATPIIPAAKPNLGTTALPPAIISPALSPDEAIQKARLEAGRKHFAEAKQALKQALSSNQKNVALYSELYDVCSKSNDWSDATSSLEKLMECDPSREKDVYIDYAKALFHLQRYDKAKTAALKAITLGKDKEEAHRLLFQIALRKKDEPAAIAEYREYLKLKPNDGDIHWEFANLLYKNGAGLKDALPEYKAAADNRPQDSYGHERAAFLLLFDKQYDASISEYTKAIKTAPPSDSGRLNAALKYAQAQQKAAAAAASPGAKSK